MVVHNCQPQKMLSGESLNLGSTMGVVFSANIPSNMSLDFSYTDLTAWTAFSACAFPLGYLGDDVECSKFHFLLNCLNSSDTKYLALSVFNLLGIPVSAKIVLKTRIILAEVKTWEWALKDACRIVVDYYQMMFALNICNICPIHFSWVVCFNICTNIGTKWWILLVLSTCITLFAQLFNVSNDSWPKHKSASMKFGFDNTKVGIMHFFENYASQLCCNYDSVAQYNNSIYDAYCMSVRPIGFQICIQ